MAAKSDEVLSGIRTALERGDYPAGGMLPSEHSLANAYATGRSTVHSALAQLERQGFLRSTQGKSGGWTVRDRTPIPRYSSKRLRRDERERGRGAHTTDAGAEEISSRTRVYFEHADARTAASLGITEGDEITVRDRVMSIGAERTQLATSRLPRTITQGTQIEKSDTGSGGLLTRLEELGYALGTAVEHVYLHPATIEEAQLLNTTFGAPTFRIIRTQPDQHGRTLEVNEMTLLDRYGLIYEVPAN